jgi:hypothetical protein
MNNKEKEISDFENVLQYVLKVQSCSKEEQRMAEAVTKFVKKNCKNHIILTDDIGNMFVKRVQNETNVPYIVAHLDTVHIIRDNDDYIVNRVTNTEQEGGGVYIENYRRTIYSALTKEGKPTGIGGDDKCGIAIALYLLTKINCNVIFFVQEEIGCRGSAVCNESWLEKASVVFQPDRKGNSDFVTATNGVIVFPDVYKNNYADLLTKYGYKYTPEGLATDVGELKRSGKLKVASANIACGYYNAHSPTEYIVFEETFNAMLFIKELCETTKEPLNYINIEPKYKSYLSATSVKQRSVLFDSLEDFDKIQLENKNSNDNCSVELCFVSEQGYFDQETCDYINKSLLAYKSLIDNVETVLSSDLKKSTQRDMIEDIVDNSKRSYKKLHDKFLYDEF